MRITPDNISELKENEIFVFGSNESGIHGGGAARLANDKFGAIWGEPEGEFGQTYAIPTKDKTVRNTLSLEQIHEYVDKFISHAKNNPDKIYLVTEIGCGLAGLTPREVAPLFAKAVGVSNISLPSKFWKILNA